MLNSLTAADLEMLARFKIPCELISKAGLFRVGDAEARSFGFQYWSTSNLAGLVFPYFDPVSGCRVTARLRRDRPEIDGNGREKAKYLLPRGDNGHLYFPPGSNDQLGDPSVSVAFVEAEKSALALTAWALRSGWKLLPIGTGGCWGWRGRVGAENEFQDKDKRGALPDFNRVTWATRQVYLIFDSNAAANPKVRKARQALAKELVERGAKVYFVNLPQG